MTHKKRSKSWAIPAILVVLAVAAAVIWHFAVVRQGYDPDARAYVDGRIERGDDLVDQAAAALDETAPAAVIRDDASRAEQRTALLFVGLTGDREADAALMDLLHERDIPAAFALSAAEGRENGDLLETIEADGFLLLSNGTDGTGNLQNKEGRALVETMLTSRQTLSGAAGRAVTLFYGSSTQPTGQVLRGAAVSGYEALVTARTDRVLDEGSFRTQAELERFVNTLRGDAIVVVNLRGRTEAAADEAAVTVQAPAIDKQPDANAAAKAEPEEPVPILTQTEWLLDSLRRRAIETVSVERLERTAGEALLRETLADQTADPGPVWRYALTDRQEVGLSMRGLPEGEALDSLLNELKHGGARMTFFLTAQELDSRADDIARAQDAGCTLGLTGSLAGLTAEQVYDRLEEETAALRAAQSGIPIFLCDGENLDAVRRAAKVLGLRPVLPDAPEQPAPGALYLLENTDGLSDLLAQCRQAKLTAADVQTVLAGSGTLPALSAQEVNALRKDNAGALAEEQKMVYTTQRTVGFAFYYGMSRDSVVRDAADRLAARGGRGTFFVTLDELMRCPAQVEYVLRAGHELGICYQPGDAYPQTFAGVASYLNSWQRYAAWRYGATGQTVFLPAAEPEEETRQAIQAGGLSLIRSTYLPVKTEDKAISPDQVPEALERMDSTRVMRGSFVCFNMGFYEQDQYAQPGNTVLGAMLDGFLTRHVDTLAYRAPETEEIEDASRFTVAAVSDVLAAPRYSFVSGKQTVIAENKNVLTNMATDEERFDYLAAHYYGNVTVNEAAKLPGFDRQEIRRLDKSGSFTDDKVLFLTFDDWGTEQSINELLYVLEKHGVKGTFFVKTQYVDANPNLLRTIAEQGHQIASHTDGHIPLADSDPKNANRMYSLTDEEAAALRKDLVLSYDKLYRYVGDVTVDGRPALTPMFRPPTLAVSKIGMSQVFDVGFTDSISGAYSTGDYEASSYRDMLNRLTRRSIGSGKYVRIQNGTVIVMHMQENAKYTAQALDTMIPIWKEQGYSFARIDDYLGK